MSLYVQVLVFLTNEWWLPGCLVGLLVHPLAPVAIHDCQTNSVFPVFPDVQVSAYQIVL